MLSAIASVAIYSVPVVPADNCSRVDAVKALATQLKLQQVRTASRRDATDHDATVQAKLEAVNDAVRTGDARKAEAALSTAVAAIRTAKTQEPSPAQPPINPAASRPSHDGRFQAWA